MFLRYVKCSNKVITLLIICGIASNAIGDFWALNINKTGTILATLYRVYMGNAVTYDGKALKFKGVDLVGIRPDLTGLAYIEIDRPLAKKARKATVIAFTPELFAEMLRLATTINTQPLPNVPPPAIT